MTLELPDGFSNKTKQTEARYLRTGNYIFPTTLESARVFTSGEALQITDKFTVSHITYIMVGTDTFTTKSRTLFYAKPGKYHKANEAEIDDMDKKVDIVMQDIILYLEDLGVKITTMALEYYGIKTIAEISLPGSIASFRLCSKRFGRRIPVFKLHVMVGGTYDDNNVLMVSLNAETTTQDILEKTAQTILFILKQENI